MPADLTPALAALIAGVVVVIATPLAIRVAAFIRFYDMPHDYHQHLRPTPLLGGSAVLLALLVATAAAGALPRYWVLIACATALWAIGTIDDRIAVAPRWRVAAEACAATAMFGAGLGWHLPLSGVANLGLTALWCIALVNSFNLMDNQDGACASVAAISALAIGGLATIHNQYRVAAIAFALATACVGFLYWNLAKPARIFLGDGGSMQIGFLIAGLGMIASRPLHHGDATPLLIALIVGVVLLDTALVIVSRTRRGVSLLTGGRDHLTHRLLMRLGSPRAVAAALAIVQGGLATIALACDRLGTGWLIPVAAAVAAAGVLLVAVLDRPVWRPAGIAMGDAQSGTAGVPAGGAGVRHGSFGAAGRPMIRPSLDPSSID